MKIESACYGVVNRLISVGVEAIFIAKDLSGLGVELLRPVALWVDERNRGENEGIGPSGSED